MNFRIGRIEINGSILLLYMSFLLIVLSGHEGIASVQSLGQYALFGLLIFFVIEEKIDGNLTMITFCGVNLFAAVFCAAYNIYSGNQHFLLLGSLKGVLYYCLFAYCGYYIASRSSADRIFSLIRKVTSVAAVVVVVQYVCYAVGIHLNELSVLGEFLFYAVDTDQYFRPAAFFSEPSYLAEIVLLDLFNSLYRKPNFKMAILDLLVLVMSTSSLGIVFGYGLFVYWAITQRISRNDFLNLFVKVVLIGILAVALWLFLGYSGDNAIVKRILGGATISERTLRAFEIYSKLQPGEQIFGIGMQNLTSYLNSHNLVLKNIGVGTQTNKEFTQSFGYVLLSLGIPGAVNYLWYIVSMAKQTVRKQRVIYVLFLAMSLTASLITRTIYVLYIAVFWSLIFEDDSKES